MSHDPLTEHAILEAAPERVARQLAQLANDRDPLAAHWLERFAPASKAFLTEVVEAVGTFSVATKTYPVVKGRRIEWATTYSAAEGFLQERFFGEDRTRKARYALAVARVLAAGVNIRRCKLPQCGAYFVHARREWCSDDCSNIAHASASRKKMTTDEWVKHKTRQMRKPR